MAHLARWWYVYVIGGCIVAWVVFNFISDRRAGTRHKANLKSINDDDVEKTRGVRSRDKATTPERLSGEE
jgi:hypothetical protein